MSCVNFGCTCVFPRKHQVLNGCSSKRKAKRHPGLNQEKYSKPPHGVKTIVTVKGERSEVSAPQLQEKASTLL